MASSKSARILIVTECLLGQWFDGVALIVRHFVRHLPEGVACEVWSLGDPGDAVELNPRCTFKTVTVPKERQRAWLLRVLGWPASQQLVEQENNGLTRACREADAILVFSSAQSPVTSLILRHWAAKTTLHLTDCSSVYALRFGNRKHYLRHRICEWKAARANPRAIVFVSVLDAETFSRTARAAKNSVFALPLGVDIDQFQPGPASADDPERPFTILFTGVLSYFPNMRAAGYIAREMLPLLPQSTRVIIAGMEPQQELYDIAASDPRLVITGALPDIEKIYHQADVFVAPMQEGTGMQNKILQALASGLPVVASPLCAAAFTVVPEAVLVRPTIPDMVDTIAKLQADPDDRAQLARAARQFAIDELSWPHRCRVLLERAGIHPDSDTH